MHDNTLTKMLATTAVFAAVAALLAGPAGAVLLDTGGDSTSGSTAVAVVAEPGTIPYLSHGIGVDESQFSGQPSLGLTGDSALTRVSAPEPEGLTGDSPRNRGEIMTASSGTVSSSDDDWAWIGLGSGLAAVFAVAVGALYLSARQRGRVALP